MTLKEKYSQDGYIPHTCPGIPNGDCFFKELNEPVNHLIKIGYLVAIKDSNKYIASHQPIIFSDDFTEDQKEQEWKRAEKRLAELYKEL